MIFELFRWWYGHGWLKNIDQAVGRLATLGNAFSVTTLLRTLFSPWRRIISYPGAGLDNKMRAALDNLVSRAVGFAVRVLVLLTVAVLAILALVLGIVQIVLWPIFPLLIFAPLAGGLL